MTIEEFLGAQMTQLGAMSGNHPDTWKQYLYKGRKAGEKFLKNAAAKLEMSLDDLVEAMNRKRDQITEERQTREKLDRLIQAGK